jgi:hypothetical protein
MTAILKTWPAFMTREKVLEVFTHDWPTFYFTLGRGRPKKTPTELYYTHHGRIIGHFQIDEIVQNVGQLPKLTAIDGTESEWQIRGDAWVAICRPPFEKLSERLFHESFRGWRYFDLETYRGTIGAKLRI